MSDAKGGTSRKSVLDVLHSIDKRLEIIVKFIGYISIFIATPALFIFAQLGLDIKQIIYGPELTPAQTEMMASLRLRGYDTSDAGALKALNEGRAAFTDYLKAGILPNRNDAAQVLSALYRRGETPSGEPDIIKGWLINNNDVVSNVRPLLENSNKFAGDVGSENLISGVQEICSSLGDYLKNGEFYYGVENIKICKDAFDAGVGGVFIVNLIKTTRQWNDLVGIAQPPIVSTARLIKLATVSRSAIDVRTPMTPQLFEQSRDGRLYRFRVEVDEKSTPAFRDAEKAYRLAVRNQDPELRKNRAFKIYLHNQYSTDKFFERCKLDQTCLLDFDAIFFGNKLYLLKINYAAPTNRLFFPYIDDSRDWSVAK